MGLGPQAFIDLSALEHNLQRVRQAAPQSQMMVMLKANAYGHGMLTVANTLQDADAVAVARVGEGLTLRQAGVTIPIVILEGCFDSQELVQAAENNLQLVIHEPGQINILQQQTLTNPIQCWLKVDTGMHRLGFPVADALNAFRALSECSGVADGVRLMTHLSNADEPDDPETDHQIRLMRPLVEQIGAPGSIANSGAILNWPESHLDWVRPGIMLYGASPFNGRSGVDDGLRPVMTLQSSLIAISNFSKGDGVGYAKSWICPENMPVGVVAIGYGDGYPRHAPSGTPVLLNGELVPLIGRVSMDMITVDLRSQPDAATGDRVTLWGRGLPAETIAQYAGTISYELFCGVTSRVEFIQGQPD
ncbi:MAG: alanine racemase [Gammaproteobacteria bacterium]|nr:alanine racemase [Gammaproteobacteria bacterium]